MAKGNSINEVRSLMGEVEGTFQEYAAAIKNRELAIADLAFTKQLSKDTDKYQKRNTIEIDSMTQLTDEGKRLKAGQVLRYIVKDYNRRKTIPLEFLNDESDYDAERYVELLAEVGNSVTQPFGYMIRQQRRGHV